MRAPEAVPTSLPDRRRGRLRVQQRLDAGRETRDAVGPQGVEHVVAVASRLEDADLSELAQVLGERRLGDAEQWCELLRAARFLGDELERSQARPVAEGLKE